VTYWKRRAPVHPAQAQDVAATAFPSPLPRPPDPRPAARRLHRFPAGHGRTGAHERGYMARESDPAGGRDRLRYGDAAEPDFQRRWIDARTLPGDEVERAFRHGFDARGRFADRPFGEVEAYLRESWRGMGAPSAW